jgi:hypothetical protein
MTIVAATCIAAVDSRAQLPGHNTWKESQSVWKLRHLCRRQALKAFPDYTAQSNANRERSERQCLEANNLPYSEPSTPRHSNGASRR